MCCPHAGHRAWHCGGLRADQCRVLYDIALRIEVHVAMRRQGCLFPVIQKRGFAIHMREHETATAYVAGINVSHRHCESGCDGSIHCIAASHQDISGHCGCVRVGNRDGRIGLA